MKIKIGRLEIALTISITPTFMKKCIASIKDGKMLQAVKIYKDNTGKGLTESRDYVFALREKLTTT